MVNNIEALKLGSLGMSRDEAIHRCQKLNYQVKVMPDGRIKPEGVEPMSEQELKDWVRMMEALQTARR